MSTPGKSSSEGELWSIFNLLIFNKTPLLCWLKVTFYWKETLTRLLLINSFKSKVQTKNIGLTRKFVHRIACYYNNFAKLFLVTHSRQSMIRNKLGPLNSNITQCSSQSSSTPLRAQFDWFQRTTCSTVGDFMFFNYYNHSLIIIQPLFCGWKGWVE